MLPSDIRSSKGYHYRLLFIRLEHLGRNDRSTAHALIPQCYVETDIICHRCYDRPTSIYCSIYGAW